MGKFRLTIESVNAESGAMEIRERDFISWYDLLNYVTSISTLEMKSYSSIRAEYIRGV